MNVEGYLTFDVMWYFKKRHRPTEKNGIQKLYRQPFSKQWELQ
jgi:hypothetical protein